MTAGRRSTRFRTPSRRRPPSYYVFDVMTLNGRDVKSKTLEARRELLERNIPPKLDEPVRYMGAFDADLGDLVESVKAQGLEGLVAKRRSKGLPGLRPGAWMKLRINQGQSS